MRMKAATIVLCLTLLWASPLAITPAATQGRVAPPTAAAGRARPVPRTADGKPDLQGIWQVRNRAAYDLADHVAHNGMPAGRSVVVGGEIPYQPWAAKQKRENFEK